MDRYIFHFANWGQLLVRPYRKYCFSQVNGIKPEFFKILLLFNILYLVFWHCFKQKNDDFHQYNLNYWLFLSAKQPISVTWNHNQIKTSIKSTKYKSRMSFSVKNSQYTKFTGFELSDWLKIEIGPASLVLRLACPASAAGQAFLLEISSSQPPF